MNANYPATTCEITRLVTHPKLVAASLSGSKTQQRRDGLYAYPDETFELEGIAFVVTSVERQRIGDRRMPMHRRKVTPVLTYTSKLF